MEPDEQAPERTAPSDYRLDDQIGYVLRRAFQRHTTIFQEEMPDGLTPTQFAAMVRLEQLGPCSQNLLGRHTAMDVATIKGVVDRLKSRGLVQVTPDVTDKRRSSVSLSAAGQRDMPAAREAGKHISDRTLNGLDQNERMLLVKLLNKIAD